jgi:hypothetical protein
MAVWCVTSKERCGGPSLIALTGRKRAALVSRLPGRLGGVQAAPKAHPLAVSTSTALSSGHDESPAGLEQKLVQKAYSAYWSIALQNIKDTDPGSDTHRGAGIRSTQGLARHIRAGPFGKVRMSSVYLVRLACRVFSCV